MRFGSVCSGIEAASVAWHDLGWSAAWFAELDAAPSAVLSSHYPHTPNLGDMTAIATRVLMGDVEAPDLLVGGTPCQAFSVAGLRNSLDDQRGQLSLEFIRLANAIKEARIKRGQPAPIIIWENVPGVLSTKDNAFGCFIGALCGETEALQPTGARWTRAGVVFGAERTVAWRVLDAQYFGVAQRRQRLFVIASDQDAACPAQILFEWDGQRRDIKPSRATRQSPTNFAAQRTQLSREPSTTCAHAFGRGGYADFKPTQIGATLTASGGAAGGGSESIIASFDTGHITNPHNRSKVDPIAPCPTLTVGGQMNILAFQSNAGASAGLSIGHIAPTLTTNCGHVATQFDTTVRRLMPEECESLQGFPQGYTLVNHRGKPMTDTPRYKMLGNSMAVPVMRWIGERIQATFTK